MFKASQRSGQQVSNALKILPGRPTLSGTRAPKIRKKVKICRFDQTPVTPECTELFSRGKICSTHFRKRDKLVVGRTFRKHDKGEFFEGEKSTKFLGRPNFAK